MSINGIPAGVHPGSSEGPELEHEVGQDASYNHTVRGKCPAGDPNQEPLTLQGTIGEACYAAHDGQTDRSLQTAAAVASPFPERAAAAAGP